MAEVRTAADWVVIKDTVLRGAWRVEVTGELSGMVTIFSGPLAQARAEEYAQIKNRQQGRRVG